MIADEEAAVMQEFAHEIAQLNAALAGVLTKPPHVPTLKTYASVLRDVRGALERGQ